MESINYLSNIFNWCVTDCSFTNSTLNKTIKLGVRILIPGAIFFAAGYATLNLKVMVIGVGIGTFGMILIIKEIAHKCFSNNTSSNPTPKPSPKIEPKKQEPTLNKETKKLSIENPEHKESLALVTANKPEQTNFLSLSPELINKILLMSDAFATPIYILPSDSFTHQKFPTSIIAGLRYASRGYNGAINEFLRATHVYFSLSLFAKHEGGVLLQNKVISILSSAEHRPQDFCEIEKAKFLEPFFNSSQTFVGIEDHVSKKNKMEKQISKNYLTASKQGNIEATTWLGKHALNALDKAKKFEKKVTGVRSAKPENVRETIFYYSLAAEGGNQKAKNWFISILLGDGFCFYDYHNEIHLLLGDNAKENGEIEVSNDHYHKSWKCAKELIENGNPRGIKFLFNKRLGSRSVNDNNLFLNQVLYSHFLNVINKKPADGEFIKSLSWIEKVFKNIHGLPPYYKKFSELAHLLQISCMDFEQAWDIGVSISYSQTNIIAKRLGEIFNIEKHEWVLGIFTSGADRTKSTFRLNGIDPSELQTVPSKLQHVLKKESSTNSPCVVTTLTFNKDVWPHLQALLCEPLPKLIEEFRKSCQ